MWRIPDAVSQIICTIVTKHSYCSNLISNSTALFQKPQYMCSQIYNKRFKIISPSNGFMPSSAPNSAAAQFARPGFPHRLIPEIHYSHPFFFFTGLLLTSSF